MSGPGIPPSRAPGLAATAWNGVPPARLVRFLAVGGLNTLFGYAVFVLALHLGASLAAALVVSTVAGILFNFQTARRLVFRSDRPGLLPRFVAAYALVFLANYASLLLLKRMGLSDWAAQAVVLPPMALLGFASQHALVFARWERS